MNIILNGATEIIEKEISIKKFIENISKEKNINLSGAVVLVNDDLVPRTNWDNVVIKENDNLEVLSFVSGG